MSETFKCIECGRNFILSYSEQRYYREQGWSLPRRCDACRSQHRQAQIKSVNSLEKPDRPHLNGAHPRPQPPHLSQKLFLPQPENLPRPQPSAAQPRRGRRFDPFYRFGGLSLGLILLLITPFLGLFGVSLNILIPAWLLAINLVTLFVYRYDKMMAGKRYTRVPEAILLGLAGLGGSPLAYVAMYQIRPRHKTQSPGFLLGYWGIVALQIVALLFYFGL